VPIRSDSTQTHPNPTHLTNARHVYFPMTGFGVSKFIAGIVVFFVSAVLHEVLVGVPLHMIRGWAFWGLMLQIPLIWLTEMLKRYFKQDRVGNAIFWIRYGGSHTTSSPPVRATRHEQQLAHSPRRSPASFCFLGQPIAEILYYHDYRKSLAME
jgi:diacylglycerol O-acyltransferase-1